MPCGTVLLFDAETEARILGSWTALAEAGVSRSRLSPGFRPHLSLSVGARFDWDRLRGDTARLAAETPAFPIGLPNLGIFADTGSVFLGVTPSEALLDLHRSIDRICSDAQASLHDWYRPDRWVPHVTIAFGLDPDGLAEAVRLLSGLELKVVARAAALALVEGDETGWTEHSSHQLAREPGEDDSCGLT